MSYQLDALVRISAVAEYDAETRAHAENFPQRIRNHVIERTVFQLKHSDWKTPLSITCCFERHYVKVEVLRTRNRKQTGTMLPSGSMPIHRRKRTDDNSG